MSNQRNGKMHRAKLDDGASDMRLRNFFRDCADLLPEDEAFYFEQIVDHLNNGKPLPTTKSEVGRLLGL